MVRRCTGHAPLLCILFAAVLWSPVLANAAADGKTARWIERIILGPEYGGSGKTCVRWVKPPTLSVFGANAGQLELIVATVAQLNEALAQTPIAKITLVQPEDRMADMRVYFTSVDEMPQLAQQLGFPYYEGNWGYFWTFWNDGYAIDRAYVLLADDRLRGAALEHFALEEITQALGLLSDAPEFPDSIFYAKGGDGGSAGQLSERDRKLIAFFYNHVEPGAGPKAVRQAIKRHWQD